MCSMLGATDRGGEMGPIRLTAAERELWDKIYFSPRTGGIDHDKLRASIEPAYQLTLSLIDREAVPKVRLRYFADPELNVGGHGKSRMQIFERNGTRGDDIFRHPHFHRYLRYWVMGPDLPPKTLAAFTALVDRCGIITSGDCNVFCNLARQQARADSLFGKSAAEEFFKLALELDLGESMSRIVRGSVMRMKSGR